MVKRRSPIRIGIRGDSPLMPSFISNNIINAEDILNQIKTTKEISDKNAYNKYNADYFNSLPKEQPVVMIQEFPTQKSIINSGSSKSKGIKYNKSGSDFVNDIYNSYYKAVRPGAVSDEDADRQARFLTQKAAFETAYGKHIANTHNYGGHRTPKDGWLAFDSMDDFTYRDVALLDKKWGNWRNAKNENEFVSSITTNQGRGHYAPRHEYRGYFGLTERINNYLNMGKRRLRHGSEISRPKAWVGAAIAGVSAATSILGSVLSKNAQRAQLEEQRRAENRKAAIARAQALTETLGSVQRAQNEFEDRFRVNYKCGGRRKLRDGVKITDGGYSIPIGYNTFLLRGGSHEDVNESGQTGIGLKVGGKVVEAENGEVIQKTPKEFRVFSDSLILPNGMTPAEAVESGINKDYVFNIQQAMNGDYGIGNKRRLRNGGTLSRPVERIEARRGLWATLKDAYNWVTDKYQQFEDFSSTTKNNPYIITGTAPAPGIRGGFNPAKVQRTVQQTKNLANSVKQAIRQATPNNTAKAVTKGPKIINAEKGDVLNAAKLNARGYSWANKTPMEQAGYAGGVAGRGTAPGTYGVEGVEGTLRFPGARRIVLNENPWIIPVSTAGGVGIMGGLTYLEQQGKNRNNKKEEEYIYIPNNRFNTPVPKLGIDVPTEDVTNAALIDNLPSEDFNVPSGTSTMSQHSNAASVPSGTSRRRLASRGRGTAPIATIPAGYAPDYTEQQMLDYINQQNQNSGTVDIAEPHYTNPAERDLINYKNAVESGQINGAGAGTDIGSGTDIAGNTNKFGAKFKTADYIGLAADAIGSIGSALIQGSGADDIEDPHTPVLLSPAKLITNYNISPQLAELRNTRFNMLRDSDEGVSSVGRLNRRNRINLLTNQEANKLWGEKTNREVEMLNQDALNQQAVHGQNVTTLNDYYNRLSDIRNRRGLMKAQAWQTGLSGLSDTVGNFLDQGKQRYSDEQAMSYYSALLPEEGRQWLIRNNVDFLRGNRRRLLSR